MSRLPMRRGVMRSVFKVCCVALVAIGASSACGNTVQSADYEVKLSPSSNFPGNSAEVSIFDTSMGQSVEWASKWAGIATIDKVYTRTIPTNQTKIIGDNSSAQSLAAGLALPQITPNGYFAIQLSPKNGQVFDLQAPYVASGQSSSATGGPRSIHLHATTISEGSSWNIKVTLLGMPTS